MTDIPYLSLAIWIPILGGLLVLATGSDTNARMARMTALLTAVLGFAVTIPLFTSFDYGTADMQFREELLWIEHFKIHYRLGIDGISMWFVLLNSFMTIIVVIAGWEVIRSRVAQYMAAFLIMSGLMNGIFSALDGVLFYVFFEASLIPLYLIIGIWGGPNRVYAAFKFFLFTLAGSLLLLLSLIYLYNATGSFDILEWHKAPLAMSAQIWIFFAFLVAFGVKVPMWPIHTWLPDAHVEAPTGGSVVLAAIALKLGAYGFIRFALPIVPHACDKYTWLVVGLSLIAVVYIGFVALAQTDMKKLVAYSSVSHMGFVTLGFFLYNHYGIEGALIQMISHGFVSGAMFLCIGVLYDRMHSRKIADYGGVVNTMPKFAAFFMLFAMANAGLPGTSGFIGEFTVILGAMQVNFLIAFLAATTLILGAAYTLWMYKRVVFGAVANEKVAGLTDINRREFLFLAVLALCVLAMGVYPKPFTDVMSTSVNHLMEHVGSKMLTALPL
ncbi:MAG: NADH-quinone oxidoreductase subunit M [Betaproteobacteria bacterium]|nr:NADH-quinone oxidoreductase subunit M [Betaproteobacteria bacterium]